MVAVTELKLKRQIVEQLAQHAEAGYPEEICGGLFGRVQNDGAADVVESAAVQNVRVDNRRRRYLIGPDDVLRLEQHAEASGLQVVGYYHSHPDAPAEPSEFDREHAWPWYAYLIVSVEAGRRRETRAWRLADDRERFLPVSIDVEEEVDSRVDS
jgi:proteasome lid subunit RPN8/RPN11